MSSLKKLEELLFSYKNPEKEWYFQLKKAQMKGITWNFIEEIKMKPMAFISLIQLFHQEYALVNQDVLKPILLNDYPIVFRDDSFNIDITFSNNEQISFKNIKIFFWHANSLSHVDFNDKIIKEFTITLMEESELRKQWEIDNFNNDLTLVSKIINHKLIYSILHTINDDDLLKERLSLWGLNSKDLKLISNIVSDLGFKNILQLKFFIAEMTQKWTNDELINNSEKYILERSKYYEEALLEYELGIKLDKKIYNQYFDYILQT